MKKNGVKANCWCKEGVEGKPTLEATMVFAIVTVQ